MSGVSFRISAPCASTSASTAAVPRQSTSTSNGRSNGHSRSSNHRRYSSGSESSDDEGALDRRSRKNRDESITAIDGRGVRSSNAPKKAAPMVIPSAPNKDFRRAALDLRAKKKKSYFVPSDVGQLTATGSDGKKRKELTEAEKEFLQSSSHVQRIGDKVVQGGIRIRERKEQQEDGDAMRIDDRADTPVMEAPQTSGQSDGKPIDADALALQELLGEHGDMQEQPKVHIIEQAAAHVTEDDAYAIDVATRPDVPTIDDYARVPIDDFGAALLRGMGGGNSALQKRKREKVEAYVPKARTALLGIGAKSREEAFGKDYVKEMDKGMSRRDGMKFVPLQKVERPSGSGSASPAPGLPTNERRMLGNGDSGSASGSTRRRRDDEQRDSGRKKSRRDNYSEDSEEERDRRRRRKERECAMVKEDDRDRDRDRESRRSDKPRRRSRSRSRDRKDRKDRDRDRDRDDRDRRR